MNDKILPDTAPPSLADRYARQTLFAGIGREGQGRLLASRVAIIGCGALGTVLANNLARAGVGHVTIADRDFIEANNLQRQVLFDEDDLARNLPKAIAASARLRRINSEIEITALAEDINVDNIEAIVASVDLVMDGTDNFETRYLLNDACVKAGKPWIYSGVIASYGVTMNILPGDTACLRCVFPEMPLPGTTPTCDTAGVLNGIVGAVASIASTEALKILLGRAEKINRAMLWMDLWENTQDQMEIPRMPDCPVCGQGHYEFLDDASGGQSASLCGRNAVQVRPPRRADNGHDAPAMNFALLAERLREVGEVNFNDFLLRFRVDGYEFTVFPDARAIIKGTDDQAIARSLYARYIGA
ncbi:MAG TPA: ThiF family adenylyltransferase [Ktedonobacterales bacterium]|jgi:adenylyltransferase/sulfurtransferase